MEALTRALIAAKRRLIVWNTNLKYRRSVVPAAIAALSIFFQTLPLLAAEADSRTVQGQLLTLGEQNFDRAARFESEIGAAYIGTWDVALDLEVFQSALRQSGLAENGGGAIVAGHSVAIESPVSNIPIILDLTTVHEGLGGVVTYAGTIRGDDGSLVAISVLDGEVLGTIYDSQDYSYIIRKRPQHENETLTVIQHTALPRPVVQYDQLPIESSVKSKAPPRGPARGAEKMGGGGGTVRILFMYTPAAAVGKNITLVANNIISKFNQTLNLSNVNTSNSVVLADIRSIGDNLATLEHRCNYQILDDMRNRTNAFANLDTWMGNAYADLGLAYYTTEPSYSECLYVMYGRIGGKGTLIPPGRENDHPKPFAGTTDTFALGDLTALHEMGHVLNGAHTTQCGTTTPATACGYVYDDGIDPDHCVWQTMMGGYDMYTCSYDYTKPPAQQNNPRIARWSNPNVNYQGVPTGTSVVNMASALDTNMPKASGWEVNPPPPPSAPNPISSQSEYCFGLNTVNWTAKTHATEYRLYKMGGYPSLLYSGPRTQVMVNVSSAGHVAVKACNISGCSGYSNQVPVTYYSTCF